MIFMVRFEFVSASNIKEDNVEKYPSPIPSSTFLLSSHEHM